MLTGTRPWIIYGLPLVAIVWFISICSFSYREQVGNTVYEYLTHARNVSEEMKTKSQLVTRSAPMNSTLGFERIEAIVLPHRADQLDILSLLGATYDLDIDIQPGVYPDEVHVTPHDTKRPEDEWDERERKRLPNAIACWRAHADLWRKMLKKRWSTMLVLEADADFGLNFRKEFLKLTEVIPELIEQLNGQTGINGTDEYDDRDPYRSQSWDFLQLGMCIENENIVVNASVIYPSPTDMTPTDRRPYRQMFANGIDTYKLVQSNQRMIKLSVGSVCTAAYAVSRRGATKLLHKTTRHWHGPVDLAINELSHHADLVAFSVSPSLFAQRKFQWGAGDSSDMPLKRKRNVNEYHDDRRYLDFDSVAADSRGFDGEDYVWDPSSYLADASATMAMSGLIWPEETDLGPPDGRPWIRTVKQNINDGNWADYDKLLSGMSGDSSLYKVEAYEPPTPPPDAFTNDFTEEEAEYQEEKYDEMEYAEPTYNDETEYDREDDGSTRSQDLQTEEVVQASGDAMDQAKEHATQVQHDSLHAGAAVLASSNSRINTDNSTHDNSV